MYRIHKVILFLFFISTIVSNCKEHHHDEHAAANIKIITDKSALSINFTVHSEPILGFEHKATSKEDKQTELKRIAEFEQNFPNMVKLSEGCKYIKQNINIKQDGHHALLHSLYNIRCSKRLAGRQIQFYVARFYPEIKTLGIEILQEGKSKKIKVSASGGKIGL